MQLTSLFDDFKKMQLIYGHEDLDAVYGCGEIDNPRICLVFMNPTGKNISASKSWKGIKAPWLGTKNVWKMLAQLGLYDNQLVHDITRKKPGEWDYAFAELVYKKVKEQSIYITNLSKATQSDARALPDKVFKGYYELFSKEIRLINPEIIITFGNQVSSIILNKSIKVSECRKKHHQLTIGNRSYKVFPVYYPVGQGMRNIRKAKQDITWILKNT